MKTVTRKTLAKRSRNSAHGGFGAPSKMPGLAYGISALLCKTGSKLRDVEGSTCADCYALKGRYTIPAGTRGGTVAAAHKRRLDGWLSDPIAWQLSVIRDLRAFTPQTAKEDRFFRWHDSGDLQSWAHLLAIVAIAENVPSWQFWLPTREYGLVSRLYRERGDSLPANLVIRVSAAMVNGAPPKFAPHTSTVRGKAKGWKGRVADMWRKAQGNLDCPAQTQGNVCGDCRACWSLDVPNVTYPLH